MEMIDALESAIKWVDAVYEQANRVIIEMNKTVAIYSGAPIMPPLSKLPMGEIRKCAIDNRANMNSAVLSEIQSIMIRIELLKIEIDVLEAKIEGIKIRDTLK